MIGTRRWQILALIVMSLVGVVFGVWLFRAGFTIHGCIFIGLFLVLAPVTIKEIQFRRKMLGQIQSRERNRAGSPVPNPSLLVALSRPICR
jgi:hypothetical protein